MLPGVQAALRPDSPYWAASDTRRDSHPVVRRDWDSSDIRDADPLWDMPAAGPDSSAEPPGASVARAGFDFAPLARTADEARAGSAVWDEAEGCCAARVPRPPADTAPEPARLPPHPSFRSPCVRCSWPLHPLHRSSVSSSTAIPVLSITRFYSPLSPLLESASSLSSSWAFCPSTADRAPRPHPPRAASVPRCGEANVRSAAQKQRHRQRHGRQRTVCRRP